MKRKILSLALALVMVLTLVPVMPSALAATDYYAYYAEENPKTYNNSEFKREVLKPKNYKVTYSDEITDLVDSIIKGKTSDYEKVKAIHDWIAANMWYDLDDSEGRSKGWASCPIHSDYRYFPHMPLSITEKDFLCTFECGRGVCEDYANMTGVFLEVAGIPVVVARGAAAYNRVVHAWNEAYVDGRWLIFDTTWGSGNRYRFGEYSEQKPVTHKYFDIPIGTLHESHWLNPDNPESYFTPYSIRGGITVGGELPYEIYQNMFFVEELEFLDGAEMESLSLGGNPHIKSVILPDSMAVAHLSFQQCANLTSVVLPNGITKLNSYIFYECPSLTSVNIPESVTSIGFAAFSDCKSLTSITIPENVTEIDMLNFYLRDYDAETETYSESYPNPNLTIYGKAGSYAETYALANGIQFNVAPIYTASTWAREGITSAIGKGFVPADIQNNYTSVITRQEFCRMAVKWLEYSLGKNIDAILSEKGLTRDPKAFTDTSDPDILAAFALGITSGTGNNQFAPNGQFNREQAATMIRNTCKAAGMDVSNVASAGFADIGTASTWAVDGVNFVRNAAIMQGTGNNNYSPKATYTREQSIITFNNIA